MSALVTGMGCVTPLGADVASFAAGLREGRNACAPREFTRLDGSVIRAPAYEAVQPEARGLLDPKKLRRMDRLIRMACVSARQALAQAGLEPDALPPGRLGVVFGTAFGAMTTTQNFIESWIAQGETKASPLAFSGSVHGIMASQIALDLGCTGPNITVSERDLSFETALVTALSLLEARRVDALLVGAADELTPLLHEFASHLMYMSHDAASPGLDPWGPPGPTIAGDGCGVWLLEREGLRRAKALARLETAFAGRCPPTGLAGRFDLVTSSLGAVPRDPSIRDGSDPRIPAGPGPRPAVLTHRGNFGNHPGGGVLQACADLLMISGREVFAPLAAGKPRLELVRGLAAPGAVLHLAHSTSGMQAGFLLSRVEA
jgi:3-oxoacyl-[acyl-carrier-protein] synthase II